MMIQVNIRLYHETCLNRSPHPNPAPIFCEGLLVTAPEGLTRQVLRCGSCHHEVVIELGRGSADDPQT